MKWPLDDGSRSKVALHKLMQLILSLSLFYTLHCIYFLRTILSVQSIRNKGQPGVSLKLHRPFLTDLVALNLIGLSEGFDAQLLQAGGGPLDPSLPLVPSMTTA